MDLGSEERACFFPLAFAATGGIGPTATTETYLWEMEWITVAKFDVKLCFSLLLFA